MNIHDKYENQLMAIEQSIVSENKLNNELADSQVERALDTVIRHYNFKIKGKAPLGHHLTGFDLAVYDAIFLASDKLLKDTPNEFKEAELLLCLKYINKSVQRWNKQLGHKGYLTFIGNFL